MDSDEFQNRCDSLENKRIISFVGFGAASRSDIAITTYGTEPKGTGAFTNSFILVSRQIDTFEMKLLVAFGASSPSASSRSVEARFTVTLFSHGVKPDADVNSRAVVLVHAMNGRRRYGIANEL